MFSSSNDIFICIRQTSPLFQQMPIPRCKNSVKIRLIQPREKTTCLSVNTQDAETNSIFCCSKCILVICVMLGRKKRIKNLSPSRNITVKLWQQYINLMWYNLGNELQHHNKVYNLCIPASQAIPLTYCDSRAPPIWIGRS